MSPSHEGSHSCERNHERHQHAKSGLEGERHPKRIDLSSGSPLATPRRQQQYVECQTPQSMSYFGLEGFSLARYLAAQPEGASHNVAVILQDGRLLIAEGVAVPTHSA